jgi:hypothetical protein
MPAFPRLGGETDQGVFELFRTQHGGKDADFVVGHGWFLFDDLARLGVSSPATYPSPMPGSDDEYQWRKVFLRIKSENSKEAYETLKFNLEKTGLDSRQAGWPLPTDWSQQLETLKELRLDANRTRRKFLQHTKKERDRAEQLRRWDVETRSMNSSAAGVGLTSLQAITGQSIDDSE